MTVVNTPVGADLCVCPHIANQTNHKDNTIGRHTGLPLQNIANRMVLNHQTINRQYTNTKTTIKNDTTHISKWYKT